MNTKPLFVRAEWDHKALVWVATCDDLSGFATESDTLNRLVQKLKIVIPWGHPGHNLDCPGCQGR